MSGEGPESIPTSADRRSKRPVKKRALTPVSVQAAGLDALFAKPDRPIEVPMSADVARVRDSMPEVIYNVQGSSSGAGSGEFHVYKASRRREYARIRQLEEDAERDRNNVEFDAEKAEREARDDEKTRRNREKREKAKARKAKGKKEPKPVAVAPPATAADKSDDDGKTGAAGPTGTADAADAADTADKASSTPVVRPGADSDDNGKDATTAIKPQAVPMPVPDGPGLVIQDDDDD